MNNIINIQGDNIELIFKVYMCNGTYNGNCNGNGHGQCNNHGNGNYN